MDRIKIYFKDYLDYISYSNNNKIYIQWGQGKVPTHNLETQRSKRHTHAVKELRFKIKNGH